MEKSGTIGKGRRLAASGQGLIALLASGLFFTLAFPPFNFPEMAWVFAIPVLLWALFGRPCKREGLSVFISGWIAWIILMSWLRNCTDSLEIPFSGALGWLLAAALALILSLFWSSWVYLSLLIVRFVKERSIHYRLFAMIGMAALWVILEWTRGVIFTGLPWLPLSVSQWDRPLLLQVASLTGGYGISFVLILVNFGFAFYIHILWTNRRKSWIKRLSFEFYLAIAMLLCAIGIGMNTAGLNQRGRTTGPKLGFVQPNAGALAKWDSAKVRENLETLADLSTYTSYLGAELILWPEAPTPLPLKGNTSMKQWVDNLSAQLDLPILAGNVAREGASTDENRKWYNAVFHVDPEKGTDVENYYSKRHLVPFGEYVPFAKYLPFVKKFVPIEAAFFEGTEATLLELKNVDGKFSKVGNLICFEDIFPKLARENVLAGADWHFVATNNTWFGEEAGAWQHAAHSVLRAVETRRPVVRCGNAGWSGWIDEYGHIRHTVLDNTGSIYFQGVEAVDFYCSNWWANRISFYVQHGDWFVLLCAGMFGVAFFGGRFYRILSRENQVPLS